MELTLKRLRPVDGKGLTKGHPEAQKKRSSHNRPLSCRQSHRTDRLGGLQTLRKPNAAIAVHLSTDRDTGPRLHTLTEVKMP